MFHQPAPQGFALEHLTHARHWGQRQERQGDGDRPALLDSDFRWVATAGALRTAQANSHYLDPQISPRTQNVLYFQSQQTQHTDFTTGEPFQTLKARHVQKAVSTPQGLNTSAQVRACPSRTAITLPITLPFLRASPHTWVLVSSCLYLTHPKAHHLCPEMSPAPHCVLHSQSPRGYWLLSLHSSNCFQQQQILPHWALLLTE